MKLYDRIDQEVEEKESKSTLFILMTIFMFITIFSGLVFMSFNRSTAKFLELQAADLETKLKLYEQMTSDMYRLTMRQAEVYIPNLIKKRYVVACKAIDQTANPTTKLIEFEQKFNDLQEVKNKLDGVQTVHMVSYKNTEFTTFPNLILDYKNKWVDYNSEAGDGNGGQFIKFKSKNLQKVKMELCALVSGTEKGK